MLIYDRAFASNDDMELASALWRRIFRAQPNVDPARLELLVNYVRQTIAMLDETPQDDILYGKRIRWLDLEEVNSSL